MWSPHTAPPSTAAVVIAVKGRSSSPKTDTVIGSKIANVPQDVPVENARSNAIIKKIAGIKLNEILYFSTIAATKPPAFK